MRKSKTDLTTYPSDKWSFRYIIYYNGLVLRAQLKLTSVFCFLIDIQSSVAFLVKLYALS